MTAGYSPSTLKQLKQLASDVVHLCDGKHAIVRCGNVNIAQYGSSGAEAVVAVQPFGVGNNSFGLILFYDAPRDFTAT